MLCESAICREFIGPELLQRKSGVVMNLSLPEEIQKLIEKRVKSGEYRTPEDVVAAAVQSFDAQKGFGDFEPGEMDALLAEGERSIEQEGTLDGDEAFRQRRQRRAR